MWTPPGDDIVMKSKLRECVCVCVFVCVCAIARHALRKHTAFKTPSLFPGGVPGWLGEESIGGGHYPRGVRGRRFGGGGGGSPTDILIVAEAPRPPVARSLAATRRCS